MTEHQDMQTACQQISELLISFQYSPTSNGYNSLEPLPQFLRKPLRNVVISLARLPLVNSYARTPPYACKLGWTPSPREGSVEMPPLPMEYLKEKEVLKEFVIRTNAIGQSIGTFRFLFVVHCKDVFTLSLQPFEHPLLKSN